MWLIIALLTLVQLPSAPVHVRVVRSNVATITGLSVVHRAGQSFITFTKNSGSTSATTYDVYRSTSTITSLSGLTKIATLDADSWHLLYDDSAAPLPHLSSGFIVTDDGAALDSTQGLLVWTTAFSGNFYYAVVNSDDPTTITVGTNSLTSPIAETHQAVPGWVRLEAPFTDPSGNATTSLYFRWEDYAIWKTRQWGYYGHKVSVFKPIGLESVAAPYPILVALEGADNTQYKEPSRNITHIPHAVEIYFKDSGAVNVADVYAVDNSNHGQSSYFGRNDTDTNEIVPITEGRLCAYVRLVRDDAAFEVNPNRIYIEGGSLGSRSLQVAMHNSTLFTAVVTTQVIIDNVAAQTVQPGANPVRGIAGSPSATNYLSAKWPADNGYPAPVILLTYTKDDDQVDPTNIPAALTAFETAKFVFAAAWGGHTTSSPGDVTGHAGYYIDGNDGGGTWDLFRFLSNESCPAFANSSNSDAVGTAPGSGFGQRNNDLDWHSARHAIAGGAAIVDAATTYSMSFISKNGSPTVDVTIPYISLTAPLDISGGGASYQRVL